MAVKVALLMTVAEALMKSVVMAQLMAVKVVLMKAVVIV